MMKKLVIISWFSFFSLLNAGEVKVNFLNIMVDDLGYSDLGCMGGSVQTPNIDKLAEQGIHFTNYRTYPKCFPTRDAIMTGMDASPVRTPRDGITIGEALKAAGYNTYFIGKTHGAVMDNFTIVPKRGFDRSFGNEDGGSYWDYRVKQTMLDGQPWKPKDPEAPFYKTDVHTDYALKFLQEHDRSKPFFLHLAYHAPHFPVHAKEEDIRKYEGKFMEGPAVLRKRRYARMKELGLITENMQLTPLLKNTDTAWEKLSKKDKKHYDRVMATYCAMVDNVDQNIGRVLEQLEEMGVRENTVIFFSSDNGATPEGGRGLWPGHRGSRFGKSYNAKASVGSANSHWHMGAAWTVLNNTPLRKWKNVCYEGGLSSPFIINSPSLMTNAGRINRSPIMVMDVLPTILDLANVDYPETYDGRTLKPMRGVSLKPILESKAVDLVRPMHFFHNNSSAFIQYPWKLVSEDNKKFELYDLSKDRGEQENLAQKLPEKVMEMKEAMIEYRGAPLQVKKK